MALAADRAEIIRALRVLYAPGDVIELRVPKTRQRTKSGYFDNLELLARAAATVNGHGPGVYTTLNPVLPALLARAHNRVKDYAETTTSDADIAARRWLLLDFDPIRPAAISSSEAEHEAALFAARTAQVWLHRYDVPAESLVLANSGNGAHLLVRVEVPNDEPTTRLVQQVLNAVALYCGTPGVCVDRTVYNAARISKLYGTVAAKGDATAERPHRRAQLLEVPGRLLPVPARILEQIAALLPVEDPTEPKGYRSGASDFDVRTWLTDHGLVVQREKPWHAGATVLELAVCPFNAEHAGSAVVILDATGRFLFRCLHNSCTEKRWNDLRTLLEPDRPRSRTRVHTAEQASEGPHGRASGGEFFDERSRFVPAWLGKHLLTEAPIHLGHDRRLWRYTHGVYRPDGDDWAKERVRELVGDAFRRQQLEQVIAWLRARLPTLGHQPPLHLINCRNGLLDWRTGTLSPHTPGVLSTNQLPIAWNPDATCLTIRRFFAETLPWDTLDLIEELFGYALYPGNPFRKAVLLFGLGANGKSVLLGLFQGLLGPENVSAVSLQALGEQRFAASDLFGKLANICGDLDARAIEHTDFFKQITGGDLVRAEFKFRDAFTFQSYALPLFSANELPRTADQTDAWFDRWIVLPMERRFEGATEDPTLATTLAAELEGLLVHAVAGLCRLMAHGRFRLPPSVVAAGRRYRQTLDTVRAFIAEECNFERAGWLERAALYRRYREWCQDSGRFPLAATTFNQHLEQAFGDRIGQRTRRGRPGWLGLAWGLDSNAEGEGGGRGDEGDAFSPLSQDTQSGAECGGRGGNSSPSSPQAVPADREPGDDDPVLDLAEALDWPCVPLRPGLTILGTPAYWITFVRTAALRDREAAQAHLEHLRRARSSSEEW